MACSYPVASDARSRRIHWPSFSGSSLDTQPHWGSSCSYAADLRPREHPPLPGNPKLYGDISIWKRPFERVSAKDCLTLRHLGKYALALSGVSIAQESFQECF